MIKSFPLLISRKKIFLYNSGNEVVPWIAGYSTGEGTRVKTETHLHLSGGDYISGGERAYVTSSTIDLTPYSRITAYWMYTLDPGEAYLVASTSQMSSHATYNARTFLGGVLSSGTTHKRTLLDIRGITGHHYIRIHARAWSGGLAGVNTLAIWLE